jgi:Putative DNA-binding domain
MVPVPLNAITEATLQELCTQEVPETQTLDFKRELPGRTDSDKSEFLKDVCALANSDGGDLIFGIEERDGKASRLSPISIEQPDAAQRRVGQILDAGLEPRIEGCAMRSVPLSESKYALIVRVPSSFQRPHRFRLGAHSRWVVRVGTHIVDLTYDQIRTAFDRTATLVSQARQFRDERLTRVLSGNASHPLHPGPLCVVHLIPIASMTGNSSVDVRSLHNDFQRFSFRDWGGTSRSLNLDGLVVYRVTRLTNGAYTQVFRNGALETVRSVNTTQIQEKFIPSVMVSVFVRDAIGTLLAAARQSNTGPAIVAIALLNVADHKFAYQDHGFTELKTADRANLILPETWIDRVDAIDDLDVIAKPLLDTLWQSFDIEGCRLYDAAGRWNAH